MTEHITINLSTEEHAALVEWLSHQCPGYDPDLALVREAISKILEAAGLQEAG